MLLLHGQPTWSYLYRTVVARLVEHGLRAVAPDLIGFGRSDKPLAAHGAHGAGARRLDAPVRRRRWARRRHPRRPGLGRPASGSALLAARPGLVRRVVAANTALHTADAGLAGRLAWACHASADGTVTVEQMLLDYQRLTQEVTPFRPSLFVQGATVSEVPDAVLAAYDAPFPDEASCAGPRQLPLLMGLTPGQRVRAAEPAHPGGAGGFDGPFLTAFSDGDPGTRGWAEVLRGAVPGAAGRAHVTLRGAGHFLQEDAGAELADVVARFVADTPPG